MCAVAGVGQEKMRAFLIISVILHYAYIETVFQRLRCLRSRVRHTINLNTLVLLKATLVDLFSNPPSLRQVSVSEDLVDSFIRSVFANDSGLDELVYPLDSAVLSLAYVISGAGSRKILTSRHGSL
jgi:hypothetical protein